MPAPAPSTRATPVGTKPKNGFSSTISFATPYGDLEMWEKAVTPGGYDNGEPIDTSTMHNSSKRTKAPRALTEITNIMGRVAYDPQVITRINTICGLETTVTVHNFDGSTYAYFGYLKSWKPSASEEGKQPEADIEIVVTNVDPSSGSEFGPVYTKPSGSA